MTDYKQLCAELLDELKYQTDWSIAEELKERASAELAEPEPEPEITHDGSSNKPTAKELQSLWQVCNSPSVFAHAVLARWGNHSTPQPIPVSERLPEPEEVA